MKYKITFYIEGEQIPVSTIMKDDSLTVKAFTEKFHKKFIERDWLEFSIGKVRRVISAKYIKYYTVESVKAPGVDYSEEEA